MSIPAEAAEAPAAVLEVSVQAPFICPTELVEAGDEQLEATLQDIRRQQREGRATRESVQREIRQLQAVVSAIDSMATPWQVAIEAIENEQERRTPRPVPVSGRRTLAETTGARP